MTTAITLFALLAALQATPTAPEARAHHQLVRDPADDFVYLVGGSTPRDGGHHTFDDVWAWDGERWTFVERLPGPRSSHRVVHHSGRGSLLLVGGTDGEDRRAGAELWERRDGRWARRARLEEAARGEPGACFDRRRGRLVLHGVAKPDRSYDASTREWDGDRLRSAAREGPGPRLGHAMAWDPVGKRCLLFGDRDAEGTVHGDTWAWDGSGWRRITDATGPSPRMMGRMAPDGAGVLLFGGRAWAPDGGHADRGDTWRLRGGRWTRLEGGAADGTGRSPGP